MSKIKKRDDFTQETKELLAKRSGYICAYPQCKRMTVARSEDRDTGVTLTGVAAHITAASAEGPRYDASMNSDERASESNGVWACQIHGKFIDDNPSKCTVEEIKRWKSQHEKWVFERVESGLSLNNSGICRLSFNNVGIFRDVNTLSLGRHNVLVGANDSGKSTLCELLSAFSGGIHWQKFDKSFKFCRTSSDHAFIEASHFSDQGKLSVRLSPQFVFPAAKRRNEKEYQRLHIEVNGCPSVDWPRANFRVLYLCDQLYCSSYRGSKDAFRNAMRYLANVFCVSEDFVWDSLREDLFASSLLGNRIRRIKKRRVEIQVPDGRTFYLPPSNLSCTELHMAVVDIAVKFALASAQNESWFLIVDYPFLSSMDIGLKKRLFRNMTGIAEKRFQTLFCIGSEEEANELRDVLSDKWINGEKVGERLTLHSFL